MERENFLNVPVMSGIASGDFSKSEQKGSAIISDARPAGLLVAKFFF